MFTRTQFMNETAIVFRTAKQHNTSFSEAARRLTVRRLKEGGWPEEDAEKPKCRAIRSSLTRAARLMSVEFDELQEELQKLAAH